MDGLQPGVVADIFKDPLGNKDAAGFADGFDTGGYIEPVPEGIGAIITDIPNVDTNPYGHLRVFLEFNLHLHGTFDRVDAAVENAEGAVAKKLEDFAIILLMHGDEEVAVAGTKGKGAVLIDMHEVRIPHDIGKHDRGQPALEFSFHSDAKDKTKMTDVILVLSFY